MVSGGGETSRRILIKDDKRAGGKSGGESTPTWVNERRVPGVVVSVKIAENKGVSVVDEVKERAEIQGVTRRA